jgi:hypothetical protein
MKGISYVTDESNETIAVQIDLKKNRKLWEDFCDYNAAVKRMKEQTKDWSKVKRVLSKKKLL